MKKLNKLTLTIAMFALAVSVRATPLTDMTPGGFQPGDPNSIPLVLRVQGATLYDSAIHGMASLPGGPEQYYNGWASSFGFPNNYLPGGTYFNTNLFSLSATATACVISWNFAGAPGAAWLGWIMVEGRRADGTAVANIYTVNQIYNGIDTITIDGIGYIRSVAFFGYNPLTVPDTGTTILLFAVAGLVLLTVKRMVDHTNR